MKEGYMQRYINPNKKEDRDDVKKKHQGFYIGQTIKIHGIKFRVRKFTNKDLILRPIKDKNEE